MLQLLAGAAVAAAILAPVGLYLIGRAARRSALAREEAFRIEKLATLGTLASGFAHEIKNPLSTLGVNLQLLEEDLATAETPRERRVAGRVRLLRKEIARLNEILEDFLRFARGRKPDVRAADLRGLLDDVLDFLAPEMRNRRLDLWRQYSQSAVAADVDAGLLKQAVLNILLNAQQAMSDGGQIIVRVGREGDFARLDFIDDGPGISTEDLQKVFNIYFSTKEKGTGLGLATTKRIVEQHNGTISLESEPGKGTDVVVRLPLSAESSEGSPKT